MIDGVETVYNGSGEQGDAVDMMPRKESDYNLLVQAALSLCTCIEVHSISTHF